MKNKILPVIAAVILIAAFGVALYPTVSQGINQLMSESAITQYNDTVDTLSAVEKARQLAAAEEYNRGLEERVADSFSTEAFESDESYMRILDVTENGQIGTISTFPRSIAVCPYITAAVKMCSQRKPPI